MHYFTDALKKYFVFKGRASRKEFWMFYLWYTILSSALVLIMMSILSSVPKENLESIIFPVFSLVALIMILVTPPYLAITVRRLHDVSKSGWWMTISFIPLIGGIWLLVLLATKGDLTENKYGPSLLSTTSEAPSPADTVVIHEDPKVTTY